MERIPAPWKTALGARYHLTHKIGEGVAALVFEGRDLKLDRDVAVKVLRPEMVHEIVSPRFHREIRIAAHLSHPHILPLFDCGEVDGTPFFVMPLVRGQTLRTKLEKEGRLQVEVAVSIARQVAAALENILFEGREALVTDFGIAREPSGLTAERLTAAGVAVGTPRYMSPEQAAGDPSTDARADVYALGCVTYEMLTGRAPFEGESQRPIEVSRALDLPPSPRRHRHEVPVAVDRAVRAAMHKDPNQRLQTARAFINALAAPLPLELVPGAIDERRRRWRRTVLALAGSALALVVWGFWARLWSSAR
jgi:serine/threonine-protein kinase